MAATQMRGAIEAAADGGDAQRVAIGIAVVGQEAAQADADWGVFLGGTGIGHGKRRGVDRIELIEELQ